MTEDIYHWYAVETSQKTVFFDLMYTACWKGFRVLVAIVAKGQTALECEGKSVEDIRFEVLKIVSETMKE
jgi:hypothetical protein